MDGGGADRGLLICGSGIGVCVAANKMPGIRAGTCHDTYSAHQGVEHLLLARGALVVVVLVVERVAGFFR